MTELSISEADLLTFFGCGPHRFDAEAPWFYGESAYCHESGGLSVRFTLSPVDKALHLRIALNSETLYELRAEPLDDLIYRNDDGFETLELRIHAQDSLWLRLRPRVAVFQQAGEPR